MYHGRIVHFFGFRGSEYISAVRVWGQPHFIHPIHDRPSYVDYDPIHDIGVFAGKESEDKIGSYRREYTDMKRGR